MFTDLENAQQLGQWIGKVTNSKRRDKGGLGRNVMSPTKLKDMLEACLVLHHYHCFE